MKVFNFFKSESGSKKRELAGTVLTKEQLRGLKGGDDPPLPPPPPPPPPSKG